MVRRPRVGGGNHHSARPDLIKYGREVRSKVPELDDVAVRLQFVFGPQQQPSAGRIEPFDARQVEGNPSVARHGDGAQAPVQFGCGRDQPLTGRRKDD
jgi:hypothetical protein